MKRTEKKKRVCYYNNYTDDLVTSRNQDYHLAENYVWVHQNLGYRFLAAVVYAIAWFFGMLYCRFGLHVRIKNRQVLYPYRHSGFYVYGNHTQPVGDVFIPAWVCREKRIFTVISPANLGIPVIGRLLPMLGGLPIPAEIRKMRQFVEALRCRILQRHTVIIYPEAHVWPYYTEIRPYEPTAFRFPVEQGAACFSMTTTYQRRHFGKKPAITVYLDGPFIPETELTKKEQQRRLRDKVYEAMKMRSKNSTYTYIRYVKR